jgi:1-deoxy-D-xylulose 5-phosphate reductoisomerase
MDKVFEVVQKGKFYPVVFNASNEVLVNQFLNGKITFDKIVEGIINEINNTFELYGDLPYTLENILEVDRLVKERLSK